uniref:Osteocalcin n=1 Tax=Monodelphis domestica TaxID=13616 RepID=F6VNB0_MONDO
MNAKVPECPLVSGFPCHRHLKVPPTPTAALPPPVLCPLLGSRLPSVCSITRLDWVGGGIWSQTSFHRATFASKRDSSELVRPKRHLYNWLPAPYPDPLEQKREVCELNPDCDELADHIGFSEAYRRFYGTA